MKVVKTKQIVYFDVRYNHWNVTAAEYDTVKEFTKLNPNVKHAAFLVVLKKEGK